MDEEELAWDIVRDRINIDVESGEFASLEKVFLYFIIFLRAFNRSMKP